MQYILHYIFFFDRKYIMREKYYTYHTIRYKLNSKHMCTLSLPFFSFSILAIHHHFLFFSHPYFSVTMYDVCLNSKNFQDHPELLLYILYQPLSIFGPILSRTWDIKHIYHPEVWQNLASLIDHLCPIKHRYYSHIQNKVQNMQMCIRRQMVSELMEDFIFCIQRVCKKSKHR